jgi:ribulose-phosphate 3-epimerase
MCADLLKMGEQVRLLEEGGVHLFHIDVMDGHFVPNLTLGPDFVAAIRRATELPIDCHLMVADPDSLIPVFADAGASILIPHLEAPHHIDRTLRLIGDVGCKAGVALNPATPIEGLEHVLELVELVVVMSVNPGFAGQKFIPYVLDKVARLRRYLGSRDADVGIMVDGGVTVELIPKLAAAGADIVVAGSSCLFLKDVPLADALAELLAVARQSE